MISDPRIRTDDNGDMWLVMGGKKQAIWLDPYWLTINNIANLGVGASFPTQIQIPGDADFEWTHASYSYSNANVAFTVSSRPIPNMSVLITDLGSSRQLMNNPVPIETIFGSCEDDPFELTIPKIFGRNTVIGFTFTNYDAAVVNGNLRCTLLGYKIFYYDK